MRFIAKQVYIHIFIISQVTTLFLAYNHITENGLIIFGLPMTLAIIASVIQLYPTRSDPDNVLNPFFHPSKTFLILVALSFVAFVAWTIYMQVTQQVLFR